MAAREVTWSDTHQSSASHKELSMPHVLPRREFLAVSAGLASASLLRLPCQAAEKEGDADPYAGLPMGIQSYSLRKFNLTEALRHIQGLGLHYVEFFGAHFSLTSTAPQIAEMKSRLEKAKLKISAHGVNGFSKDHAANRKIFEFAKAAGIRNITADPAPDSFDSLDKLVEEFDIRIAIHNHGPGHRYDGLASVQKAVKDHHKLIGACVDTGHVLRSNEDPVKWVNELGPRVFALHIKDVEAKTARTHDVVIGKGHLDVEGIFRGLKKIGFPSDGSISIEYESNPENPVSDIAECLTVARGAIRKVYG
jgi:sugar phosphate isomerase/epimerase